MKNKRYSYYLLIVLAALLLAVDAFYVTYGLVNNKEIFDTVGVIFLSINSAVIVIIFFVSGNNERNMIIRQNLYNFNRKTLFSNFNTFVTLVGPRYLKVSKTHEEEIGRAH